MPNPSEIEETEIEITDAMEAAGVAAYYAIDMRVADIEYLVREIYRAMRAARG